MSYTEQVHTGSILIAAVVVVVVVEIKLNVVQGGLDVVHGAGPHTMINYNCCCCCCCSG